jgi:hypothetical protein
MLRDLSLRVSQNNETNERSLSELVRQDLQRKERILKLETELEELRSELRSSNPQTPGMLQLVPRLWQKVEALESAKREESRFGEQPVAVTAYGVRHNFQANVGAAAVTLNSIVDSSGLYVQVDGIGYMLIPWALIDKLRAERDEALKRHQSLREQNPGTPWWKQ